MDGRQEYRPYDLYLYGQSSRPAPLSQRAPAAQTAPPNFLAASGASRLQSHASFAQQPLSRLPVPLTAHQPYQHRHPGDERVLSVTYGPSSAHLPGHSRLIQRDRPSQQFGFMAPQAAGSSIRVSERVSFYNDIRDAQRLHQDHSRSFGGALVQSGVKRERAGSFEAGQGFHQHGWRGYDGTRSQEVGDVSRKVGSATWKRPRLEQGLVQGKGTFLGRPEGREQRGMDFGASADRRQPGNDYLRRVASTSSGSSYLHGVDHREAATPAAPRRSSSSGHSLSSTETGGGRGGRVRRGEEVLSDQSRSSQQKPSVLSRLQFGKPTPKKKFKQQATPTASSDLGQNNLEGFEAKLPLAKEIAASPLPSKGKLSAGDGEAAASGTPSSKIVPETVANSKPKGKLCKQKVKKNTMEKTARKRANQVADEVGAPPKADLLECTVESSNMGEEIFVGEVKVDKAATPTSCENGFKEVNTADKDPEEKMSAVSTSGSTDVDKLEKGASEEKIPEKISGNPTVSVNMNVEDGKLIGVTSDGKVAPLMSSNATNATNEMAILKKKRKRALQRSKKKLTASVASSVGRNELSDIGTGQVSYFGSAESSHLLTSNSVETAQKMLLSADLSSPTVNVTEDLQANILSNPSGDEEASASIRSLEEKPLDRRDEKEGTPIPPPRDSHPTLRIENHFKEVITAEKDPEKKLSAVSAPCFADAESSKAKNVAGSKTEKKKATPEAPEKMSENHPTVSVNLNVEEGEIIMVTSDGKATPLKCSNATHEMAILKKKRKRALQRSKKKLAAYVASSVGRNELSDIGTGQVSSIVSAEISHLQTWNSAETAQKMLLSADLSSPTVNVTEDVWAKILSNPSGDEEASASIRSLEEKLLDRRDEKEGSPSPPPHDFHPTLAIDNRFKEVTTATKDPEKKLSTVSVPCFTDAVSDKAKNVAGSRTEKKKATPEKEAPEKIFENHPTVPVNLDIEEGEIIGEASDGKSADESDISKFIVKSGELNSTSEMLKLHVKDQMLFTLARPSSSSNHQDEMDWTRVTEQPKSTGQCHAAISDQSEISLQGTTDGKKVEDGTPNAGIFSQSLNREALVESEVLRDDGIIQRPQMSVDLKSERTTEQSAGVTLDGNKLDRLFSFGAFRSTSEMSPKEAGQAFCSPLDGITVGKNVMESMGRNDVQFKSKATLPEVGNSERLFSFGVQPRPATEAEKSVMPSHGTTAGERLTNSRKLGQNPGMSKIVPYQKISQYQGSFKKPPSDRQRHNTWCRSENSVVPVSAEKLTKVQSSYVRKGHSLIRKPSSVVPSSNPFVEQTTLKQSGGLENGKNIKIENNVAGTLNSFLERPKTPPLPLSDKLSHPTLSCSRASPEIPPEPAGEELAPFSIEKENCNNNVAVANSTSVTKDSLSELSTVPLVFNYRRIRNKLIRDLPSSVCGSSSKSAAKDLKKATVNPYKSSRYSLVWTLNGKEADNHKGQNLLKHHKVLPNLFPWKRTTRLSNVFTGRSYSDNHPSLLARKLQFLRRKNAPSSNPGTRRIFKCGLKWSKSMEKRSKKASEEAASAVAEHEKKRRKEEGTTFTNLGAKKGAGSSQCERIFRVGVIRYKMDPSRRTLIRIPDEKKPPAVKMSILPRRLSIGNDEYVRVGNGNQLVRDPKKLVRILANEKIRWSIHTARLRSTRKQRYCLFFTRFGRCNKGEGKCRYVHDPNKVAICTKFLKGQCSDSNCKLTHKVIPERMPDCSYFLEGFCTNGSCPYRHVNVNPKASVCEGFLRGYCRDGDECRKKHSYVCPQFEASGECPRGTACKLLHKKAGHSRKRKRVWAEIHARGRYFGGAADEQRNLQLVLLPTSTGLEAKGDADVFFQGGRFTEFIGLDDDDDDDDDDNDDNPDGEGSFGLAHGSLDSSNDEAVIKPLLIMNR